MSIEQLVCQSVRGIEPGIAFDTTTIVEYLLREHTREYIAFAAGFIEADDPDETARQRIASMISSYKGSFVEPAVQACEAGQVKVDVLTAWRRIAVASAPDI